MKRVVILSLFLFISLATFPSGYWGSYMIIGMAKHNGELLVNDTISVQIGCFDTIIQTDSNGLFEIVVSWSTFHPVGISSKIAAKQNPRYIAFIYKGRRIKVKNQWRLSYKAYNRNKVKFTKKVKLIEYESGKEPSMFGELNSFYTPNISIRRNLRF